MSKFAGNPFINWKYFDIRYNGQIHRLRVKAFECGIGKDGLGYHVKFKDKDYLLCEIKGNWHQINNPNAFATMVGGAIGSHVSKVMHQLWKENLPEKREKGEGGTWGNMLRKDESSSD